MKNIYTLQVLLLTLLFTTFLYCQTTITFDDQGWSNDQTLSSNFTADNFNYSSNENFYTNYGYNFDVNSNSLYYVFQSPDTDEITITSSSNSNMEFNSVDAYQVSETSTDTLIINGWNGSTKLYSKSFYGVYSWQTLNLNYNNINKVTISLSPSASGQLTDYNFDNFSFNSAALPVELTTFTAAGNSNGIELQWKTATEINNYGFNIERSSVTPNEVERQSSTASWQKIGFVKGSGNSNSPKSYSFTDKTVSSGVKYSYRLKQIDYNGNYIYSNHVYISANLKPDNYILRQNYPNPFNPSTRIEYSIPNAGRVVLKVYDVLGNEVMTLVDGYKSAGKYTVSFNGEGLASGIYIYEMRAGNFLARNKMILLK